MLLLLQMWSVKEGRSNNSQQTVSFNGGNRRAKIGRVTKSMQIWHALSDRMTYQQCHLTIWDANNEQALQDLFAIIK